MRWALPLLALSACAPDAPGAAVGQTVACGSGPALDLDCTVERQRDRLTLRQPDGAFRRLTIVADGRGLVSADGAEEATVRVTGNGQIDVRLGGVTYRLPATIAGS